MNDDTETWGIWELDGLVLAGPERRRVPESWIVRSGLTKAEARVLISLIGPPADFFGLFYASGEHK